MDRTDNQHKTQIILTPQTTAAHKKRDAVSHLATQRSGIGKLDGESSAEAAGFMPLDLNSL